MKTRLIISVELNEGEEQDLINEAKGICQSFWETNTELDAKVTLVRDGDRSALNILLPKVEGRFGEHYQSRKATLKEILDEQLVDNFARMC